MKLSFTTGALLALACLFGIGGGIALSFKKQHDDLRVTDDTVAALDPGDGVEAIELESGETHDVTTPDPESLRGLPVFPGSDPRKLVGVPGTQMNVSWFSTDTPFSEVMGFYRDAFEKAGLVSVGHAFNEGEGYVAWLERDPWDPDAGVRLPDGILHMATVIRESDQTIVLLSATRPTAVVDSANVRPAWFIEMPGASEPRFIDSSTDGTVHQTVYFDWPDTTEQRVKACLLERYGEQGWRAPTPQGGEAQPLTLLNSGRTLEIQVRQNQNVVAVVITAHAVGGRQ